MCTPPKTCAVLQLSIISLLQEFPFFSQNTDTRCATMLSRETCYPTVHIFSVPVKRKVPLEFSTWTVHTQLRFFLGRAFCHADYVQSTFARGEASASSWRSRASFESLASPCCPPQSPRRLATTSLARLKVNGFSALKRAWRRSLNSNQLPSLQHIYLKFMRNLGSRYLASR